ncbi:hypothetical protein ACFQT0_16410 [Hymenobacter humi]|uniref:Peptidylprolyl isomerase n=1 Tax=Hymenobacter humi TaxID=1411620 RepID=A0ABW2U8J7_9BACT
MAAISDNKVVTITYDLSVTDENQEKVLVESAEADSPMVFLFGHSGLPEEFEAHQRQKPRRCLPVQPHARAGLRRVRRAGPGRNPQRSFPHRRQARR